MKKQILSFILIALVLVSVIPAGISAVTADASPESTPAPENGAVQLADTADGEPSTEQPSEPATEAPTEEPPVVICPQITSVTASPNGALIQWTSAAGAAKYYVYSKDESWKRIAITTATSFEHKKLTGGKRYLYTVRAVDADGRYLGEYDHEGYSYRYLATPKLTGVANVYGGQRVNWNAVTGAGAYRVYIKSTAGWKLTCVTNATTAVIAKLKSGMANTYTVRAVDSENPASFSSYDKKGISGVYIASVKALKFNPVKNGVTVSWSKSGGAARYAFFIRTNGKWKKLATTVKPTYTHTGAKIGTQYTYTVRCLDKNGKFCSGYNAAGFNFRQIAAPVISKVTDGTVYWNTVNGASSYLVYRRQYGKSWASLATSAAASYADGSAANGTLYAYTVRCLDKNGRLISYFKDNGKYYCNGKLANGKYTVGGKVVMFTNGVLIRKGYATINGKMYYFDSNGVMQKNGVVGTAKEGYRYADKNGVVNLKYTGLAKKGTTTWYFKNGKLDTTLRAAVTVSGTDYNVLDGKAYKVSTTRDRTLFRALKIVAKVTKPTMTKAQKLRACWNHIRSAYGECNPRNPEYFGNDWPEVYANDIFVDGTGNCFSYAAAFAYLAKAVGYPNCYACNSGGHGWSEIDGLVYDAEWSMHNFNYTYYALSYDTRTDVPYKAALSIGQSWSHRAI